ncbi:MAG: hypothetical protein WDZ86_05125, partial [Gammaproteobacteria bacterium]
GQRDQFQQLARQLKDYPLYVYLRYDELRPRLARAEDAEILEFLEQYPDFPHADSVRQAWLQRLAHHGRWTMYLEHFGDQQGAKLRCLKLQAQIKTGSMDGFADTAKDLWLVGKSQIDECDPVFAHMRQTGLLDDELILERLRLALANNQTGLANYLTRQLSGDAQNRARHWISMHQNPDAGTANPILADNLRARELLTYGIRRLARINLDRALQRWPLLQKDYTFTPEQQHQVSYEFAIQAVRGKHDQAAGLLARVPPGNVDGEIFIYQLRHALNTGNWRQLRDWTDGEPPEDIDKNQWYYWHARALEELGETESARNLYRELAAERDYYGFLAADRFGAEYQMNHVRLPVSAEQRERVAQIPGIQRAFEFKALGEQYSARREWHNVLKYMTSLQIQIAAQLAAD